MGDIGMHELGTWVTLAVVIAAGTWWRWAPRSQDTPLEALIVLVHGGASIAIAWS